MIILVGIGCFMAGAVVGIVMMSLCVASHNSIRKRYSAMR